MPGLLEAAVGRFSVVLAAVAPAVTTAVRSCMLLLWRPLMLLILLVLRSKGVLSAKSVSLLLTRGNLSLLGLGSNLPVTGSSGLPSTLLLVLLPPLAPALLK